MVRRILLSGVVLLDNLVFYQKSKPILKFLFNFSYLFDLSSIYNLTLIQFLLLKYPKWYIDIEVV